MEGLIFLTLAAGACSLRLYLSYTDPDTARDWEGFLRIDDSTGYILNSSPSEIAILDLNDSSAANLVATFWCGLEAKYPIDNERVHWEVLKRIEQEGLDKKDQDLKDWLIL